MTAPRDTRPRWTNLGVAELRRLYEEGASHRTIGEALGRSRSAINKALCHYGIAGTVRRPASPFAKAWTAERIEKTRAECVALYPEFLPTEIARKIGVTKDFVRAAIKLAGRTVSSTAEKNLFNGVTVPNRFPIDDLLPVDADRATPWRWASDYAPHLLDDCNLRDINQARLRLGLPSFIVRELQVS